MPHCGRTPRAVAPAVANHNNKVRVNMTFAKHAVASLALPVAFAATAAVAYADNGVITKPSKHSVQQTVAYFEEAVKQKESMGFALFTTIDHAAAAKKAGLEMRPRVLIMFGNPRVGTPVMIKTPLLAIDVPLKALVWEDDQGKVWLSYNSAEYFFKTIYPRHGVEAVDPPPLERLLDLVSDQATQ
jgi:uncharacterized protein (DUF302 family)